MRIAAMALLTALTSLPSNAAEVGVAATGPTANPLTTAVLLGLLSLMPFLMMMTTSFLKFAVVLSILRNAMGTQQIPPNPVLMGLAVILTVYVMAPVGSEVMARLEAGAQAQDEAQDQASNDTKKSSATNALGDLKARLELAQPPVRDFLARHAKPSEVELFLHWAHAMGPPDWRHKVGPDHLLVLIPAFAISELTEAFAIGFLLFLPFLVVDMVVSNILLAMGMHMLSPVVVSLPFKLLLFIMIDGWSLLARGLLAGYLPG